MTGIKIALGIILSRTWRKLSVIDSMSELFQMS